MWLQFLITILNNCACWFGTAGFLCLAPRILSCWLDRRALCKLDNPVRSRCRAVDFWFGLQVLEVWTLIDTRQHMQKKNNMFEV